jgi:pyridoxal phosphate enzyme (YggS family)
MAALSTLDVAERLADVRGRIERAGGDGNAVTVVAMTKGFGMDAVEAAAGAGVNDFGENYVDELLAKRDPVHRWHFLGRIQRRDVRRAEGVTQWQSVDRVAAGEEIAKRWPGATVLVQVNTSGEGQKQGCTAGEAPALVDRLRDLGLDVRGLMTIGPAGPPEDARPAFRALAELGRRLQLSELSMGMTGDLEVAVQEGSTMVRVGRALFGPRPDPPQARR